MTFSIVARDPATGQIGVAVASCSMAIGRAVPWARAGVGAVATQSNTRRSYGARGLDLLETGAGPSTTLATLLAGDPQRDTRQVAIVDSTGVCAAHTGADCLPECGHVTGLGYSVQGNMLADPDVTLAMARAYELARGDLAERLLIALDAGQAAGGDLRGRQAAALLVVSGNATDSPWDEVLVDLRVDDADAPLPGVRRLLNLQRAYERGDYETLAVLGPPSLRELYRALSAARRGDREAARAALSELRERPGWQGWLRRMGSGGRIPFAGELLASGGPPG